MTHTSGRSTLRRMLIGGLVAPLVTALAACSLVGSSDDEDGGSGASGSGSGTVVLLTHDSFALPKGLIADFERRSGYDLEVRPSGDAGQLATKLAVSAGNPLGDVVFGIDNAFASRVTGADVLEPTDTELPAGADEFALPGDQADLLTPVDQGSVCVNVDSDWFAAQKLAPPKTLEDLTRPKYADLFVTPGATSSSPGLAFLLATIDEYGADWPAYWQRLMANGARLTSGWEDAYFTDFTGGSNKGTRPIVVSYDSSPAFTVDESGKQSSTAALLDTCFQQVEYAGALKDAENPEGARAVLDWLHSPEVQAALPNSMYVFPVAADTKLPPAWARFAKPPEDPTTMDPARIAESRQDWLTRWRDITSR